MSVIRGKDVILYFNYNGLDQVVACFQSCSLHTQCNIGETSTLNSGKSKTFIPLSLEWDGSCSGLISLNDNISLQQMHVVQDSLKPILMKFVKTDTVNGLTEIRTGYCIITDIVENGSFQSGLADYSITIKGNGDIGSELPVTVPEGCELFWYYYDATGAEGYVINVPAIVAAAGTSVVIDSYLYRDGIAYFPSGPLHDGSTTPGDKEFEINYTTGDITFSTTGPTLYVGEQFAVPYLVCTVATSPGGCVAVTIEPANLPDATVGEPYDYAIRLDGDAPFSLVPGVVKPSWMTVFIDGDLLKFTGTPTTGATNVQVSLTVSNCSGANTDSFSDTIDVTIPGDAHFTTTTFVSSTALNDFEIANIAGIPASVVTVTLDTLNNTNGGRVQVNGTDAFAGNTWNVTMDGTGHGSLHVDILGASNPGTFILAHFTITAVSAGTIGSPSVFQTSKAFT